MNGIIFLKKYKIDLFFFLFLLSFLPLFLYNLGGFGLTDFDEAWYAEIARNILKNREPILLSFNDAPYTEHPPLGFDLIAFSFVVFGINEFAARFPSAILGWGCLILTYLIGKRLVNRWVGIGASLMLFSSVWFMFRARSGNLDTIFLFFYILSIYAAIKIKDHKKWLYVFAASFAAVLLVKSVIGISILIPAVIFVLIEKVRLLKRDILRAFLVFFLILSPWIIENLQVNGLNYFQHMVLVGLRPGFRIMPNFADLLGQTAFQYLHFGIGKWYKIGLISFFGLLPFLRKYKSLISIYALLIFLLVGFLTNSKTEIWHLIPLYPFWGLLIASFLYIAIHRFLHLGGISSIQDRFYGSSILDRNDVLKFLLIIPIFSLSFYQIYQFRNGIKLFDRGLGGLATVSQKARYFKEDLYLDGHDFLPSAVFYAQRQVKHIRGLPPPRNLLKGFITESTTSALLLTQRWRLDLDKIDPSLYETLAEKEEWMLIRVISPASK